MRSRSYKVDAYVPHDELEERLNSRPEFPKVIIVPCESTRESKTDVVTLIWCQWGDAVKVVGAK